MTALEWLVADTESDTLADLHAALADLSSGYNKGITEDPQVMQSLARLDIAQRAARAAKARAVAQRSERLALVALLGQVELEIMATRCWLDAAGPLAVSQSQAAETGHNAAAVSAQNCPPSSCDPARLPGKLHQLETLAHLVRQVGKGYLGLPSYTK